MVNHFKRLTTSENYFKDHYSIIKHVEVHRSNEVRFVLKKPYPRFLYLLAGVAARHVKKHLSDWVGIGPFVPKIFKEKVILEKLASSATKDDEISKLTFYVKSDSEAVELAKQNKVDDIAIVNSSSRTDIPSAFTTEIIQNWVTWGIVFDQRVKPFNSICVRAVLSGAIRSEQFVSEIYSGENRAFGLVPMGMLGYLNSSGNDKGANYSIERCSQELKIQKNLTVKIHIPAQLGNVEEIEKWLKNQTNRLPFKVLLNSQARGSRHLGLCF